MYTNPEHDGSVELLPPEDASTITAITAGEVNQQVATAHRFPRDLKRVRVRLEALVTRDEAVAQSMSYALPRGKDDSGRAKTIEGPSARFAEVLAHAWGNMRIEARPVAEGDKTITSRGTAWDLEANVAIAFEVTRRITGKNGARFSDDMIAVTNNAAGSIALRNAVLKVVPKSEWEPFYQLARKTAIGDARTLVSRRKAALDVLTKYGATPDVVLAFLQVDSVDDIGLEHLGTLQGIRTALKDGEISVEEAFGLNQGKPASTTPRRASEQKADEATQAAAGGESAAAAVSPAEAQGAATDTGAQGEAEAPAVHTVTDGGPMATQAPEPTDATAPVFALRAVPDEQVVDAVAILEVIALGHGITEITGKRKGARRDDVWVCHLPLVAKLAASCAGADMRVRMTTVAATYGDDTVRAVTGLEVAE